MQNDTKKTCVVTGATQGIGLEVCRQLLERGYQVVLTGRTQPRIDEAMAELGSPEGLEGHVLDVASQSSIDAFYQWFFSTHAQLDVLVNNAGRTYGGYEKEMEEIDDALLSEAIDNNALGAWRMMQAVLPKMNARGYGRIVNVSSGMGALEDMGTGAIAYRVSKTALNALTRQAAHAARGDVKVNVVCPGWVRTAMGGEHAHRSVEEGAAGIVWGATLPENGPNNGFFRDGEPIAW